MIKIILEATRSWKFTLGIALAALTLSLDMLSVGEVRLALAIFIGFLGYSGWALEERELSAYRRDAERYRWLRARLLDGDEETCPCIRAADNDTKHWALSGVEADAAIDRAMSSRSGRRM